MTNKEITYILMQYFAKQILCDADDFLKNENIVILKSDTSQQFFKMCCFGNSAVASVDKIMYDWCKSFLLMQEGFRCFDGIQMIEISKKLFNNGFSICCGQGMLPDLSYKRIDKEINYDIKYYTKNELFALANDDLIQEIQSFTSIKKETEHLFIAYDKERIIGVTPADKQDEKIYELGVEVLPEYRRFGIATALTTLATNELLNQNLIPYALTSWSNIRSRGVLQKCGYYPAWVVMDSLDLEWANEILYGKSHRN